MCAGSWCAGVRLWVFPCLVVPFLGGPVLLARREGMSRSLEVGGWRDRRRW